MRSSGAKLRSSSSPSYLAGSAWSRAEARRGAEDDDFDGDDDDDDASA
jgi:hypothetical protein